MIKFGFDADDGQWRFAIRPHDAAEESSVWHVKAAHVPFSTQAHTPPKNVGIYEGYFEVEGPDEPATLTLVARATKLVEDELEEALNG